MTQYFVYAQTVKGQEEMASRTHQLEARYRRFLSLINGRRSVAELGTVARPGELAATLDILIERGFIEKIGTVFIPDRNEEPVVEDPFSAASLTPAMYAEIKRRAMLDLSTRIGAPAAPVIGEISACDTPEALRHALRSAEVLIAASVGAEAARKILQNIGRNLV